MSRQSFTTTVVNELPEASATSKKLPVGLKLGVPTGSVPYWESVTAPGPLEAVTVTPSLLAWQTPDVTEHDWWLVALEGGVGGVGALGDGAGVETGVTKR